MGLNRYSSPVLLNWVEPYKISGIEKTLFYTEVNTNFQVDERVFIINGNYDSDLLISSDKYKKGRDGYKVLAIDGCKVVLDIDYTGDLPNRGNVKYGDNMSDYIGLYYIDSYESYLTACRQVTTRGGLFDDKFNYYQNNIAFIDANHPAITKSWGFLGDSIKGSPGFFVKDGKIGWTNITGDFFYSGTYSQAVSPLYYNNGKIKVMGKSFTYNGFEFKEGFVYKWENKKWAVDVTEESKYVKAIISKSNFRDGDFKGTFNNGLYGTKSKKIAWTGEGTWNGGTLLNSVWQSGTMNSTIGLSFSYKSTLDQYGLPKQNLNGINNNGYGFNYIIDSEISLSDVDNGIIRNTKVGSGLTDLPVVENHIKSTASNFSNIIRNASFEFCEFSNIHMIGGVIKNSKAKNSKFTNVKVINSSFKNSVISESTLISDSVIKILGYDEWNSSNRRSSTNNYSTINSTNFKVYKFYIGESDFFRLKQGDVFHIKGIKINDGGKSVLSFFDRKYRIGSWTEYFDAYSGAYPHGEMPKETFYKRGVEHTAFLSTQEDNENVYNSTKENTTTSFSTNIVGINKYNQYSIDVFVSMQDILDENSEIEGLNFNYGSETTIYSDPAPAVRSSYIGNKIDISGAYIIDSNFESGIVESSDWNSGPLINYNGDLTITSATNSDTYNLSINSDGNLVAKTLYNPTYPESYDIVRSGDILFLNSVEYDTRGKVISVTISNSGTGYGATSSEEGALAPTYAEESPSKGGYGLRINNTVNSSAGIDSVQIASHGFGYSVGDILKVLIDGQGDAEITITAVDNGLVRLADSYRVDSNSNGTITLSEIVTGTVSIISGLTAGGRFITDGAENRWGYLSKTKINRTKIKSGIFKRNYIYQSVIQSEGYDSTDKDYNNLNKIRELVLSDQIFKNNANIMSSATYINSHFFGGSDVWDNGIIQNSILNGVVFNKGVIKESTWLDGTFNGGVFYNSRTFNGISGINNPYYYSNNTKSYYAKGTTTATESNTRQSWRGGLFNGGEFLKSDWEGGTFSDGVFYNSKWYSGTMNGGILGDNATSTSDTAFYNGTINYATVENATVLSKNVNYYNSSATVIWNDGIFNKGVFGSDGGYSVWKDGIFNGGQFVDMAVWEKGTFNGGQFTSGYGWTSSGSYSYYSENELPSLYTWQDGVFNGGEFGNAGLGTNSTWYTGEFNGGVFQGRVWNFGVFTNGDFKGSGGTAIGGTESQNAQDFADAYRSGSFYGLWKSGLVTDKKDIFIKDKKFSTILQRSADTGNGKYAIFSNVVWLGGNFNHTNSKMTNSVWRGGNFQFGKFELSAFNPYIFAPDEQIRSFNKSDCFWENGTFDGGDFYYSNWYDGTFISGTAYGMVFLKGTSNYMNANNIFWENGTWKNGNWNGSAFEYDGGISSSFAKEVLLRIATYSESYYKPTDSSYKAKYHIWNIFENIKEKRIQPVFATPSLPISAVGNATPIGSTNSFPPVVFSIQQPSSSGSISTSSNPLINPQWLIDIGNQWTPSNYGDDNDNLFSPGSNN